MRTKLVLLSLIAATCASVALAATTNYTYDDTGRLISVAYPNGTVISYTYDKAGNLLSRVIGSSALPTITGVVNGASFLPGIAAATWITIQGTNLSSTTRSQTATA